MSKLSDAILAIPTLLGYWQMQETSGTTIDDSESTNDLTLVGATLGATGLVPTTVGGISISFDGTDDYLIRALPAAFKVDPVTAILVFRMVALPAESTNVHLIALEPRQAFGAGKGILIDVRNTGVDGTKIRTRKGNGTTFITQTGDTQLNTSTTLMLFAEIGTTGLLQWLKTVVADPVDIIVAENGPQSSNTDAIDWTDGAAGNYPDPAQMYVAAARSNVADSDNTAANVQFINARISDLAICDGTLTDTQRSDIYEAATVSLTESWAHPSTARSLSVASLTADDPLDLVESGHKE